MCAAGAGADRAADVVVVGAGVIGLAVALELRRAGVRDVLVLEQQHSPGMGSTSRANGGVRAQFATATNIAFSQFTIAELAALDARSQGRCGLRRIGYLFMAGEDATAAQLGANVALQRSLGVGVMELTPNEVSRLVPIVRVDGLIAAAFCADDGVVDPNGVVAALHDAGRELGVRYRFSEQVIGLEPSASGATVHCSGESFGAAWVVNTAGPAAADVAALAGVELAVQPYRHNLAVTEPIAEMSPHIPMCVDMDTGVHIRGEAGGAIIGWPDPHASPTTDTSFDPQYLEAIAERVGNRFPLLDLAEVSMRKCWAGLYPETPDHNAIIGAPDDAPWFIQCCGFGGHGIMHSLAAGRAVAELMRDGACSTFDVAPLRPQRFQEGVAAVETAVL